MECEYCKNSFKTKSSLVFHQKSTKYCLEIQGKTASNKYICEFCDKEFIVKISWQRHIETHDEDHLKCKEKINYLEAQNLAKDDIIIELKENVRRLERVLEKVACTKEPLMSGSVTLGKEQNNEELEIDFKKSIEVIDIRPYDKKDVLYFLTFTPCKNLNIGERKCYKFGVTSNISGRLLCHENDKKFNNVLVTKIFKCKNRTETSELEKYIKRLVRSMKLYLEYSSKKECFIATEKELEKIYIAIEEFLEESDNEEEEKEEEEEEIKYEKNVRVSDYKEKIIYDLFKNDKLNFDQMKELISII